MINEATEQLFWSQVNKNVHPYCEEIRRWRKPFEGTPCWGWTGQVTDGYGWFNGMKSHKYLWTQLLGRDHPEGFLLHHQCRYKLCCNPEHLELLTPSEHSRRHGKEDRYRLSPAEQLEIMRTVVTGEMSVEEAAWLFGVHQTTIGYWTKQQPKPRHLFRYNLLVPNNYGGNSYVRTNNLFQMEMVASQSGYRLEMDESCVCSTNNLSRVVRDVKNLEWSQCLNMQDGRIKAVSESRRWWKDKAYFVHIPDDLSNERFQEVLDDVFDEIERSDEATTELAFSACSEEEHKMAARMWA